MWFHEGDEKGGRKVNRKKKWAGDQLLQVNARSQEKKQAQARWISAVVALLVALGGCVWVAMEGADWLRVQLFASNPLFTMREPDIRTDGTLKPQEIRERYNLNAGVNLFAVNLTKIHADLLTLPGVRSVEIRRQLPDTLVVRVGERSALALLVTDRMMSLPVDREGYVLVPRAAVARLPVIVGATLPGLKPGMQVTDAKVRDALAVLDLCEALHIGELVRVDAIHVSNPDNLDVRLATGERVPMARTQLEDRLRKLVATKKSLAERHQVASVIDCSLNRNVPVTLVPPALSGVTN